MLWQYVENCEKSAHGRATDALVRCVAWKWFNKKDTNNTYTQHQLLLDWL